MTSLQHAAGGSAQVVQVVPDNDQGNPSVATTAKERAKVAKAARVAKAVKILEQKGIKANVGKFAEKWKGENLDALVFAKVFFTSGICPNREGNLTEEYRECVNQLFDALVDSGYLTTPDGGLGVRELLPKMMEEFVGTKDWQKATAPTFGRNKRPGTSVLYPTDPDYETLVVTVTQITEVCFQNLDKWSTGNFKIEDIPALKDFMAVVQTGLNTIPMEDGQVPPAISEVIPSILQWETLLGKWLNATRAYYNAINEKLSGEVNEELPIRMMCGLPVGTMLTPMKNTLPKTWGNSLEGCFHWIHEMEEKWEKAKMGIPKEDVPYTVGFCFDWFQLMGALIGKEFRVNRSMKPTQGAQTREGTTPGTRDVLFVTNGRPAQAALVPLLTHMTTCPRPDSGERKMILRKKTLGLEGDEDVAAAINRIAKEFQTVWTNVASLMRFLGPANEKEIDEVRVLGLFQQLAYLEKTCYERQQKRLKREQQGSSGERSAGKRKADELEATPAQGGDACGDDDELSLNHTGHGNGSFWGIAGKAVDNGGFFGLFEEDDAEVEPAADAAVAVVAGVGGADADADADADAGADAGKSAERRRRRTGSKKGGDGNAASPRTEKSPPKISRKGGKGKNGKGGH